MIIKQLGKIVNTAPVPYISRSQALTSVFKKETASTQGLKSYSSVSTLFSIVSRLANDTSAVNWKLYKKLNDRRRSYAWDGMDSREEVVSHPVLNLLNRPNSFMTRQELFEIVQQHIDLAGEAFIIVKKFAGIPYELWPYRPDMMRVAASAENYIAGYVAITPDNEEVPFDPDEVIHLRMPNPMNPFRGVAPVASLLVDLDSHRMASEFNRNFFLNDATPGGMIVVPRGMNDAEFERTVARYQRNHKGVSNAHKVAFIEEGNWISTATSMKEMQFVELRQVSEETILKAFGFPKFKLGIVQDVNRASAEASDVLYAKSLMVPRLERIKQALNNDLLSMFGTTAQGVELDYCNPVPEDRVGESAHVKTKIESAIMLINAGFDPQETLEMFGLPAISFVKDGIANGPLV